MTELTYDFTDPAFLEDPYPYYDHQRKVQPICYSEKWKLWVFTTHEYISNLVRDRRIGRAILHKMTRGELGWPPEREELEPFVRLHRHRLLDIEPPDHTRIRTLVQKVFTPQTAENLRQQVQMIADNLLNRVQGQAQFDLLADYAVPLPVTVIAELLGVPEGDRHMLHPWSQAIVAMYELNPTVEDERAAVQASIDFPAYLKTLVDHYRRHPQPNLISDLVQVEEQGDRLTEQELISTCVLLLNAGHEATVNVIGNGMLAFFKNPDQLEKLRQDPGLIKGAVEEMLRYDSPLQFFKRWAMEDVEYKGHVFPRGTQMGFTYGSANRDPKVFAKPHSFDITRKERNHLSFGLGTHFCLGAPLARVELQTAVETLLRRMPHLHLADDAQVAFKPTYVIRGLQALPVCSG